MQANRSQSIAALFKDAHSLVKAAAALRAEGITRMDAFTPYQVEELDEILQLKDRKSQMAALVAGVAGAAGGYFLQYWANAVAYAHNVGGRPGNSVPAYMPVTFEGMVLTSALVTLAVLLFRMGLPKLHQSVFGTPGIKAATQDGYLLALYDDSEHARVRFSEIVRAHGGSLQVEGRK